MRQPSLRARVVTDIFSLENSATPPPAVAVRRAQIKITHSRVILICARTRSRTWDPISISDVLYQLSYARKLAKYSKKMLKIQMKKPRIHAGLSFYLISTVSKLPSCKTRR